MATKAWQVAGLLAVVVAVTAGEIPAHSQIKSDEFLFVPLRIHLLSGTNAPALHTTLTEKDVARILPKINRIWAQAGICFYLESLRREEAEPLTGLDEALPGAATSALLSIRPKMSLG